jgi:quercetin dioxygenase-like cupin family protein
MEWTKTSFDALADKSPEDLPMQWRFARGALGSPELGVSRFTYEPGARMPWGHRHKEQDEAYVVVAGSGRAKLDDEIIELRAWDVLRVAPAVMRSFEGGRTAWTSSASAAAGLLAATPRRTRPSGPERAG